MRGSSRKRISNSIGDWNRLRKVRKSIKLVRVDSPKVIQGLVSLEAKSDHVFLHLVENSLYNRFAGRKHIGVAGNLFASACMLSLQKGFQGFVCFDAKTKPIAHYQDSIGAKVLSGNKLFLDEYIANQLVNRYFSP